MIISFPMFGLAKKGKFWDVRDERVEENGFF